MWGSTPLHDARTFEKHFKDLKSSVQIKGFRPGKVPRSYLQRRFGEEIAKQVKMNLLEDSLDQVVKENNLNPVGEPEFDFGRLEELTFAGKIKSGHYTQELEIEYQAADIRFTVKGENIYAICLDWPGEQVTIETLGSRGALLEGEIKNITMLGVDGELDWRHEPGGLIIDLPPEKPCDYAYAIKIERKQI